MDVGRSTSSGEAGSYLEQVMEAASTGAQLDRAASELRRRGELAVAVAVGEVPGRDGGIPPLGGTRPHPMSLRGLRSRYGGVELSDLYEIEPRSEGRGVLKIRHRVEMAAPLIPEPDQARATALGRLDLVFGIGELTARRLRDAGVSSVDDLALIERYEQDAREVLHEWEARDLRSICSRLTRRLGGGGHLLSALLCGFVGLDRIAFFDLETMGLWNNMIFLGGIGTFRHGAFEVEQFLAPLAADEAEVVSLICDALEAAELVVTFNGRTSDMAWLSNRAFYHGLPGPPELPHVDLVYGVRRRYGSGVLPDARLSTVQSRILAMNRPDEDVPGWLVPMLYEHYSMRPSEREGLLVPLVEHNRSDIEALAALLGILCREARSWT